jgi:alkanesulfonate monooxygenase SsuD/methylene tetrahydromethanopterin reductase-like flavin-dependent oxidoreductase (luciferase family)
LWVTGANRSTARIAGEKGLGLAIFSFAPPEALAVPINAYREGIAVAQPVGAFVNDQVMTVQVCLCLEDGELARKIYRQNIGDYMPYFRTYFDTVVPNEEAKSGPLTQSRYRELVAEAKRTGADAVATYDAVPDVLTREYMIENGLAVGDPDDIIEVVRRYEAAGVDQIVLSPICGNTQPLDATFQSIENVGK